MRAARTVARLAVAILSLSTAVSALQPTPYPAGDPLIARQDDSSESEEPISTPTTTTGRRTPITTDLNTGTRTTGPGGGRNNSTATKPPSRTMFDPQSPAGNIVMLTPAPTLGYALYKIGDYITWGWNYTNLLATPTAIDMVLSCNAAAKQTWTLTANMSFASPGSFTWDSGAFQSAHVQRQLPVEEYTLLMHDADSGPTAALEPGYLAPFNGFTFGLYTGKAPTPLGEWKCATCSGAMSDMERRVLGGAVAMSVATVLSFTWFVGGFAALL